MGRFSLEENIERIADALTTLTSLLDAVILDPLTIRLPRGADQDTKDRVMSKWMSRLDLPTEKNTPEVVTGTPGGNDTDDPNPVDPSNHPEASLRQAIMEESDRQGVPFVINPHTGQLIADNHIIDEVRRRMEGYRDEQG